MKVATYSRYSSNSQREASCADQERICVRRIEAEGWQLVEQYRDEAISGSRADRPAYQQMLKDAHAHQFDVLLVDDLSRFSRDQVESERAIRRLEFDGIRILAVSDGYDSQSKSRKIQRGVKGLMNEVYLDDLKDKTHRGLEGQALKKFWAGGKPYGYKLVRVKDPVQRDAYGDPLTIGTKLEVNPDTAGIIIEIFQRYADDWSPRSIADELNRRGVPSPGSAWRGRKVRRLSGWLGSGVKAILENPIYRGEYHWNVTTWLKDPDSGKRRVVKRPKSDWVSSRLPELQIVPDELWRRVQARYAAASRAGANIREGIRRAGHRAGRSPAYLFSSLLKCGVCGANMTIIGGQGQWKTYGCATHKEGGSHACAMGLTVKLPIVEDRLLRRIKEDLLSGEVIAEIERRFKLAMARQPKRPDNSQRLRELRGEVENLTQAIASGALIASKAIGARLVAAEQELERIMEAPVAAKVVRMPISIGTRYRKMVETLETELCRDVHRARTALRQIVGDQIPVVPHASGKHLVARIGLDLQELVEAAGNSEIFVVAGAGYSPYIRPRRERERRGFLQRNLGNRHTVRPGPHRDARRDPLDDLAAFRHIDRRVAEIRSPCPVLRDSAIESRGERPQVDHLSGGFELFKLGFCGL